MAHNTPCWKFAVVDKGITILPDLLRRTSAVDPDDHHLFVSLGCAAENLVQAALAHGLAGEVRFDAASDGPRDAGTHSSAGLGTVQGHSTNLGDFRGEL